MEGFEQQKYNPTRKIYEINSATAWLLATAWMMWLMETGRGANSMYVLMLFTGFMAVYRILDLIDMVKIKRALLGKSISIVGPEYVKKKARKKPDHLWLGWGFEWSSNEAQLHYDLEKLKLRDVIPPILRKPPKGGGPVKGFGEIHGIHPKEKDIYIPYKDLEGHCFIPATTGALKTRLMVLIALQSILRKPKQAVYVVDPKGDPELLKLIKWACKAAGREDDFCYLHPAFPKESIRLDLLKNWTTTTEGASRMAELIGGDESSAPFKAYGWQVINNLIQGMLVVGERPQLTNLRSYLEGGPDHLILRLVRKYIKTLGLDPEESIQKYMGAANKVRGRQPTTPKETVAAVLFYKKELQEKHSNAAIDGLLTMYEHDQAHFGKMIATLQPIMSMLTSDELRSLLSPDYTDPNDSREILDNAQMIRTGKVFYLGLHSMPDATVSTAIGSLFLADMVAVLGERNVRNERTPEITLLLDEANEIVNPPLVQMLNKGRSAGLMTFFFTQTIQDFIAKYGSEAPAMQLLGNANNLIFGRVLEPKSIEYIEQKVGETTIEMSQKQYSISPTTEGANILDFNAPYGIRKQDLRESLVRPEVIRNIPNMEYFGVFSGHRIIKGRAPVVLVEKAA